MPAIGHHVNADADDGEEDDEAKGLSSTGVSNDGETKTYEEWKLELRQMCWDKFDKSRSFDFFHAIEISRDGGFSEVHDLWYRGRFLSAVIVVALLISNLSTIVVNDKKYLFAATTTSGHSELDMYVASIQDDFLITGYFADWLMEAGALAVGKDVRIHSYRIAVISGIELFLLAMLILKAITLVIRGLCAKSEMVKWCMAEEFFWKVVPELSTFSAMRLLHFASPSVIIADAYKFMTYSTTRWAGNFSWGRCLLIQKWSKLVITRLLCLIIGIDAFLFKVRVANKYIHQNNINFWGFLSVTMFIVQILGIVQLSMFVRGRIFLFIFGGEDGVMQAEERATQTVWEAMLVRKIWKEYSLSQTLALLLTFDDADFQRLVLNQKANLMDYISSDDESSGSG